VVASPVQAARRGPGCENPARNGISSHGADHPAHRGQERRPERAEVLVDGAERARGGQHDDGSGDALVYGPVAVVYYRSARDLAGRVEPAVTRHHRLDARILRLGVVRTVGHGNLAGGGV
jgi:hypothetical protein